MKTITAREYDQILDIRNESLSSLPPGIFEKDLLLTQALRHIASTDTDGAPTGFAHSAFAHPIDVGRVDHRPFR